MPAAFAVCRGLGPCHGSGCLPRSIEPDPVVSRLRLSDRFRRTGMWPGAAGILVEKYPKLAIPLWTGEAVGPSRVDFATPEQEVPGGSPGMVGCPESTRPLAVADVGGPAAHDRVQVVPDLRPRLHVRRPEDRSGPFPEPRHALSSMRSPRYRAGPSCAGAPTARPAARIAEPAPTAHPSLRLHGYPPRAHTRVE